MHRADQLPDGERGGPPARGRLRTERELGLRHRGTVTPETSEPLPAACRRQSRRGADDVLVARQNDLPIDLRKRRTAGQKRRRQLMPSQERASDGLPRPELKRMFHHWFFVGFLLACAGRQAHDDPPLIPSQ